MTMNWEVFDRDPRGWEIPNQGVTKVGRPKDQGDWDVLRWELESFVCDGEYADGLQRILDRYLGNLDNPEQAAVWVSGFYGSGKSHLVRILAFLWSDEPLPDGSTPRGISNLPSGVKDALKELSTAGNRSGGLWSAAGKLGSGVKESYRLAFLSVLFASAGLPQQYPAARLAMMLKREGVYEDVIAHLEDQGKDPDIEFLNLYASPILGQAVVDALPDFATDQRDAREIFRDQYPPQQVDISDNETITVMQELLELQSSKPGEIPCTVIVLDELQQYIGTDNEKLDHVQNITELCATNFDSKVMIVGTGQSALQGSRMLSKIQDRFYLRVELSDRDVEQVTRQLVLRKKPDKQSELSSALDGVSGEINKHLTATKIGAKPGDAGDLTPDYPILPVRRRFWERALRAIDAGGGSGQLRTQLRVTHDANQHVAEAELGTVVGADFIFSNQATAMLSTRVLSQEMYQRIKDYETSPDDGELKSRILGLVVLMSRLPRDEGADAGVRARPDMLAELLVEDLRDGSAHLQPRIESALAALVKDGVVVDVEGEYRLQTPEGAELRRRYQERFGQIRSDDSRILQERDRALRTAIENSIGGLKVNQGASNVTRRPQLVFGFDAPDITGKDVPVWVRDEWSVSSAEARATAQRANTSDPTVFVVLPKQHTDRLRDTIASHHAAREVLDATAVSDTPEGYEARAGLEGQLRSSQTQLDQLVGEILASAKVWQAGGNEVSEGALPASVHKAVEASLTRKFPKFKDADHPQWGLVLNRAKEGNENPLDAVGFQGGVADHPVCKALLSFLANGKKGVDVRAHFEAGEYGWSKDAINGALLTLVAAGLVGAQDKKGKGASVKDIRDSDINATTFKPYAPDDILAAKERIEARKLAQDLGVNVEAGQEADGATRSLQRLLDLAGKAGGDAPLPVEPDTSLIKRLQLRSGNRLVKQFLVNESVLRSLYKEWTSRADSAPQRMQQWSTLQRLLSHATGLAVHDEVQPAVLAVTEGRQLLENPDPVQSLLAKLVDQLRNRVKGAHQSYLSAVEAAVGSVKALPEWSIVGDSGGREVLDRVGLRIPSLPSLGTAGEVLAALDAVPLSAWMTRSDATPARVSHAQEMLAKLAEPEATIKPVPLPKRVLKTTDDIDSYVEEIRGLLHAALTDNTHLSV